MKRKRLSPARFTASWRWAGGAPLGIGAVTKRPICSSPGSPLLSSSRFTDFTAGIVAGWHSTIFPPYFVAGAIFSGFAMVLTLAIPLRKFYGLENLITIKHLENCAKLLLTTGLIVAYGYAMETFLAWYSDNTYEKFVVVNRAFGPYWPAYWILIACNVMTPQFLWFKRIRTSVSALFVISILVNIGMWAERYVIVVTSLHRDFLPSSWGMYAGTRWDWATLIGSMGLFLFLFLLFVRLLPTVAISEVRELVHKESEHS
jgi:Ni/Fe-hydrogenase subunit HybB-like protein